MSEPSPHHDVTDARVEVGSPRRSLLFVPAIRPDRFDKAAHSGADLMCLDLEDSIPPGRKAEARGLALGYLRKPRPDGARRFLRINTPRRVEGVRDLLALLEAEAWPDGLMVPKVATAEEIRWVDELVRQGGATLELLPIIETADGLARVEAIAGASDRVACLAFGSADYAAETGADSSWDALLYARGRVVAAAALRRVDAMDGPWLALDDADGLGTETRWVAQLGFTGKMAVHPRQVPVIHAALTPTPARVEDARRVVEAFEAAGGHAVALDGHLLDEPVVAAARRVLATGAHGKMFTTDG